MANSTIEDYVYKWAISFPLDRWWRKKHNVPFGSAQHRDVSFIDQFIEYQEDAMYLKFAASNGSKYQAGHGKWLREDKLSQVELDEAFDDLNLDNVKD